MKCAGCPPRLIISNGNTVCNILYCSVDLISLSMACSSRLELQDSVLTTHLIFLGMARSYLLELQAGLYSTTHLISLSMACSSRL